jgi:hypothetical protein
MNVLEIDPEAWYYAMYDIDNEGNRINKVTALQGKDLTENQIKTAEPINES